MVYNQPMPKILITGNASGLGRYLYENLPNAVGLGREDNLEKISKGNRFDAIIHCAFKRCQDSNSAELPQVLEDNLFLTEKLFKVPHEKFIYLSSNTVYPPDSRKVWAEDMPIDIDKI